MFFYKKYLALSIMKFYYDRFRFILNRHQEYKNKKEKNKIE